jgi:excinuclease ABC subunit C
LKTEYLKTTASQLPKTSGCYLFKNSKGVIIYVGKAKNLRNRVGSYFQSGIEPGSKTYALVQKIANIEHIETESELEALVLEAELIKKHHPRYNISLKDDKSYIYIVIRVVKEKLGGKTHPIKKVFTARKLDIHPKDTFFGPYPDGRTTKYVLRILRRMFPFCDCASTKFSRYHKQGRPCLYGQIGKCAAPCVHHTEAELGDYRKVITQLKKFLSGQGSQIMTSLRAEMKVHSRNQDYEEAAKVRDLLEKFDYIRQQSRSAGDYIQNPTLLEDIANQTLHSLKNSIPTLKKLPKRIECYDISNISGQEAVGSMVVATNGTVDSGEYKRFKIKTKKTPDDAGMLAEVLHRRLKRKDWPKPDLIVLDGGKGQVSAVLNVMEELEISFPLIGLAKKQETIVYANRSAGGFGGSPRTGASGARSSKPTATGPTKNFKELNLPKDDPGQKLLVHLRDESHRFAQKYHHLLRAKSLRYN